MILFLTLIPSTWCYLKTTSTNRLNTFLRWEAFNVKSPETLHPKRQQEAILQEIRRMLSTSIQCRSRTSVCRVTCPKTFEGDVLKNTRHALYPEDFSDACCCRPRQTYVSYYNFIKHISLGMCFSKVSWIVKCITECYEK